MWNNPNSCQGKDDKRDWYYNSKGHNLSNHGIYIDNVFCKEQSVLFRHLTPPRLLGNKTTTNKVFDYETLKKYKKRKISDFQKNLLSKKSLEKYKEECINLISKDIEIKTLMEQIGINKEDDYLIYVNNNFFSKPHFLFTLEILILEAVEEANTLKVFRTNKNVLPLKVVKENYYRDEIIKDLKIRIYEGEYKNKFKNLMKSLDGFIDELKKKEI